MGERMKQLKVSSVFHLYVVASLLLHEKSINKCQIMEQYINVMLENHSIQICMCIYLKIACHVYFHVYSGIKD